MGHKHDSQTPSLEKPEGWTDKQWQEWLLEREIKLAGGSPSTKVHIDEKGRAWFYYGGFTLGEIKWPQK